MDDKEWTLTETKRELMQWIEQTKRLLMTLPSCLDELDQLRVEASGGRQRISELEHDNEELRRSRDELAELLAKLRALIVEQLNEQNVASGSRPDRPGTAPPPGSSPSAFEAAKARATPSARQTGDQPLKVV